MYRGRSERRGRRGGWILRKQVWRENRLARQKAVCEVLVDPLPSSAYPPFPPSPSLPIDQRR